MRKGNYATYVNEMTPIRFHSRATYRVPPAINPLCCVKFAIDTQYIEAYLYLRFSRAAHGKGKKARPEERSAVAGRRAQSQSRSGARRLVYRQSNHRCCRDVRRHPADLLQGPERAADDWSCWSAAEQTRSQERPQDLHRGGCLRCRSQNRKPRSDDFAMCRCDRNAVRNQGAPAQPGTGAGAQKKTNQSNLIVAPSDTTERYETLRAAVLRGGGAACPGLGILHHRGVAEWIRALGQEPPVEVACSDDRLTPLTPHDPAPATSDITRLVASILVAIAMEPVHA